MSTEDFINAWRNGKLKEPEDPEALSDFFELGSGLRDASKNIKSG